LNAKTLGRYRILGELGRGAMGAVFRAIDPLIEREVALKTLLPDLPEEVMAEVRERFLREARSAGRLNHPNIVIIHDVGEQDGVAYIAMELLEGRSLQQMLKDPQRIPLQTTADLAAQIADALEHAHNFSIVHRDVKPANVILSRQGEVKIVDFSIAQRERLPSVDEPATFDTETPARGTSQTAFGTPALRSGICSRQRPTTNDRQRLFNNRKTHRHGGRRGQDHRRR